MIAVVKVRKVGQTMCVTLPKELAESACIKKGDRIMVSTRRKGVVKLWREGLYNGK